MAINKIGPVLYYKLDQPDHIVGQALELLVTLLVTLLVICCVNRPDCIVGLVLELLIM